MEKLRIVAMESSHLRHMLFARGPYFERPEVELEGSGWYRPLTRMDRVGRSSLSAVKTMH